MEPRLDEVELLAAIDLLRKLDPEEREAVILALEYDHPGIGRRAEALVELEKQAAEAKARVEAVAKPDVPKSATIVELPKVRWKKIGSVLYKDEGKGWRRHLGPPPKELASASVGVPQLKVVEQAKPEPEAEPRHEEAKKPEPEPEQEEPRAEEGERPSGP